MKINVEVDCTPEEARRFMGLPDLTPVHDVYVAQITDSIKNGVSSEMVESLLKNWAPMGEVGMKAWQNLFNQVGGSSSR
jgi:hypothetical protein